MDSSERTHLRGSIRKFVALWMSAIIISIVFLSVVLLITGKQFRSLTKQTLSDSKSIELTHMLELAILSVSREDLLWRTTHDKVHFLQKDAELKKASDILLELDLDADSREEELVIDKIKGQYQALRVAASATPPSSIVNMRVLTKAFMDAAENYREQNKKQLEITVKAIRTINSNLDRGLIVLSVFVTVILAMGSFIFLRRIIKPTIELSRVAARFGQGDLNARATVMRDDEMGNLCQTFNNMAEDIAHREKDRHEFIASIAHDVKTPLVFIGGAVRMLSKRTMDHEQSNPWMDRIIKQVKRLEDLTTDFIDTEQVQSGQLTLQMGELDLTSFVRNIQEEQAACLSSHSICFEGAEPCRILCDARRLERVTMNLISNAVKYSPGKTTILLKVYRLKAHGVLVVKDEGVGISPEDLKLLFQPFGRLSRTQRVATGNGLGLFVVKKIVEAHNGKINVMSEPDIGTTVEILFPLAATAQQ